MSGAHTLPRAAAASTASSENVRVEEGRMDGEDRQRQNEEICRRGGQLRAGYGRRGLFHSPDVAIKSTHPTGYLGPLGLVRRPASREGADCRPGGGGTE